MFQQTDKINIPSMQDRLEEQAFLLFVMGLVKYHLSDITNHKNSDRFDVGFEWGGAGPDTISIFSKENKDALICFGTANNSLGYSIYSSISEGRVEDGDDMDKEEFTIKELNDWLIKVIKELIFKDKVSEWKEFTAEYVPQ